MKLSPGLRRLMLVLGVLALLVGYHLAYVAWLNPVYGYLGFGYADDLGRPALLGYVLGLLPAAWMPIALKRPSQYLQWMIYVVVFLPAMLTLAFIQLEPAPAVMRLQLTLLAGLAIIGAGHLLPVKRLPAVKVSPRTFWLGVAAVTLALLARVVSVYWGQFQFVAWDKTYESLRFTGSDIAEAAGLAYPINWLSLVFLPLLCAVALLQRRPWLFALVAAGDVLLYMTQGMKHILFSCAYIFVMFLLLRRDVRSFGLRIVWWTAAFFAAFFCYVYFLDATWSSIAVLLGANVLMRMFGTPGLILAVYQHFLSDHPLTYYSHITGINRLVPYPYEHPLGIEVGMASTGALDYNMNAGFWVSDGLAAIGLPGILLVSLLVAAVFYVVDCVSTRHRAAAVALCLAQYAAIPLLNVSFFTSLITGGLSLFILIFVLMPAHALERKPAAATPAKAGPAAGAISPAAGEN